MSGTTKMEEKKIYRTEKFPSKNWQNGLKKRLSRFNKYSKINTNCKFS